VLLYLLQTSVAALATFSPTRGQYGTTLPGRRCPISYSRGTGRFSTAHPIGWPPSLRTLWTYTPVWWTSVLKVVLPLLGRCERLLPVMPVGSLDLTRTNGRLSKWSIGFSLLGFA